MEQAEIRVLTGSQLSANNGRMKGILMVLSGAVLWGLSGTAAQVLFQYDGFSPAWLVTIRMIASGLLLLLLVISRSSFTHIIAVWRNWRDAVRVVLFGVFGLLGVQYTYFASIADGNAATATLLQYLGPVLITVYLAMKRRRMPNVWEFAAVFLALLGTFLLVTDGQWRGFSVPAVSVAWGLLSALALAFYTLYPNGLLQRHGPATIVGWSMLVGGFAMACKSQPWHFVGHGSSDAWWLVGFVVVFGTLLAFYLYISSLKYISPSETSLLACAEPLSSAVVAMVFLNVRLGMPALFGGLCILVTVALLALKRSA